MACKNFVCAFSHIDRGKVSCTRNTDEYKNAPDCTASSNNFCGQYKYFSCKICGHDNVCNRQREKGVFYSSENGGAYTPSSSTDFSNAVKENEFVNAKRDIFTTACSNYRQGYRTSTTVRQLFERYNKKFPQFTKEYLDKAVHLSIIKYLETEE